jgi:hypothetical protein
MLVETNNMRMKGVIDAVGLTYCTKTRQESNRLNVAFNFPIGNGIIP